MCKLYPNNNISDEWELKAKNKCYTSYGKMRNDSILRANNDIVINEYIQFNGLLLLSLHAVRATVALQPRAAPPVRLRALASFGEIISSKNIYSFCANNKSSEVMTLSEEKCEKE